MNSGGNAVISKWMFMIPFALVYIPLVWIRKTEKLAFTHLLSDVIIAFVIVTVCVYGGIAAGDRQHNEDLVSKYYTGFAGFGVGISSSVYAFEGIAVVLPVREITAD